MRPVLASDLLCAGRAVLAVAPESRVAMARRLVAAAEIADAVRQSSGARHPEFGDGTLAAAARHAGMADERTICDPDFAHALILLLLALVYRGQADRSR
ncbi:hypothetical protein ACERZ8_17050 [Tateyamaria armeniaca]|uniref:DUF7742 domain-containing protein n=1 Tax=Tateyamaria armeniaca TaxID=2518930 RepID=A0ABW8UZR3_9RHOB